MLLRLNLAMLNFIPFIPRGLKFIKKFLGLASACGRAIKMIGSTLFNMPLKVLKTVIKIQIKIVSLPFRVLNSFYKLIFNRNKRAYICDKYIQVNPVDAEQTPCEDSLQVKSCKCSISRANHAQEQSDERLVLETRNSEETSSTGDFKSSEKVPINNENFQFENAASEYYIKYSEMVKKDTLKLIDELHKAVTLCVSEIAKANSGSLNMLDNNCGQPAKVLQRGLNEARKEKFAKELSGNGCATLRDAQYLARANCARLPEMSKKRSLVFSDELYDFLTDFTHENYSERFIHSQDKKAKLDKSREFATMFNSEANVFNKLNDSSNVPLTTGVSTAIRSLKNLQHKRDKLNYDYNSIAKDILSQTFPVIKQAIQAANPHVEKADSKMNTSGNFKLLENKSPPRISKNKVSNEKMQETNGHQILHLSIEVLHSLVDIISQEINLLKRRLATTNSKMAEVKKSSDNLFEEISKINERFSLFIALSTKVTKLQQELGEDQKILKEVEADRNEMQLKLITLETLIKEEEEYLDDVSIESGYDEFEIRDTSPYKHDDF